MRSSHKPRPDDAETPIQYATRIARYIRDASTVRARTIDFFGRAPSVEHCKKIVAAIVREEEVQKRKAERRAMDIKDVNGQRPFFKCGHPRSDENISFAGERVLCRTCKMEANRKWKSSQDELRARMQVDPIARQAVIISAPRRVLAKAAELYGMDAEKIRSRDRRPEVVRARQAVAYAIRRRATPMEWGYSRIAAFLNLMDHTTVIHAVRQAEKRLASDPVFAAIIEELDKAWLASPPRINPEIVARYVREAA